MNSVFACSEHAPAGVDVAHQLRIRKGVRRGQRRRGRGSGCKSSAGGIDPPPLSTLRNTAYAPRGEGQLTEMVHERGGAGSLQQVTALGHCQARKHQNDSFSHVVQRLMWPTEAFAEFPGLAAWQNRQHVA